MVTAGDLGADPLVTPTSAGYISDGLFVDLEQSCAIGEGKQPSLPVFLTWVVVLALGETPSWLVLVL